MTASPSALAVPTGVPTGVTLSPTASCSTSLRRGFATGVSSAALAVSASGVPPPPMGPSEVTQGVQVGLRALHFCQPLFSSLASCSWPSRLSGLAPRKLAPPCASATAAPPLPRAAPCLRHRLQSSQCCQKACSTVRCNKPLKSSISASGFGRRLAAGGTARGLGLHLLHGPLLGTGRALPPGRRWNTTRRGRAPRPLLRNTGAWGTNSRDSSGRIVEAPWTEGVALCLSRV
mmetsp:Transcript_115673/g.373745  ORF Transcript_115673/g.373745 Transcript_115673/m.373745 type:complete len:232 (-) Transcript_115673:182-877(-)